MRESGREISNQIILDGEIVLDSGWILCTDPDGYFSSPSKHGEEAVKKFKDVISSEEEFVTMWFKEDIWSEVIDGVTCKPDASLRGPFVDKMSRQLPGIRISQEAILSKAKTKAAKAKRLQMDGPPNQIPKRGCKKKGWIVIHTGEDKYEWVVGDRHWLEFEVDSTKDQNFFGNRDAYISARKEGRIQKFSNTELGPRDHGLRMSKYQEESRAMLPLGILNFDFSEFFNNQQGIYYLIFKWKNY